MKLDLRIMIRVLLFVSLLGGGIMAGAQDQMGQSPPPQPDNTKTNQRDRKADEPTADQQKANQSDRDMTRQIRKSIEKDRSLSTYGHNVKVITQNGTVTLKGPVRSEEEKKAIEQKATEVAGADKVTSEIDVQPKQ
jgi:hyperosmotically inducible periplasmic protein